jgi:hypothetical protein
MSSRSEQWSKSMSGEMVLQFAIVCKGLLRLNVCNSSHLKLSKATTFHWTVARAPDVQALFFNHFAGNNRPFDRCGSLFEFDICAGRPVQRRNCAIRSCRTAIGKQPICGTNCTPVGRRTTRSSTNRRFHEARRTAAEIKILGEHDPRQTARRKGRSRRLH